MSKSLYFECFSGISGDMAVGALIDLGADVEYLKMALSTLKLDGFETVIKRVDKNGISAVDFDVLLDDDANSYDHDTEYLYGDKEINFNHSHHSSRNLADILDIINSSEITDNAKKIAARIFEILASAEAKAHNKPIDEVHFHEVGAVDSIVDIVAFSVCFDNLGIDNVITSELCDGKGTVRCQHGVLPVPVPAVMNIVKDNSLPLTITDIKGELVTPTGAAIIAAVRNTESLPESFVIKKLGIGAGKRKNQGTGILRAMIIE